MKFVKESEKISDKTSVALGIFDGVHLGHREILNTAESYTCDGLSFAVFTFNTSSVENKHGKPYKYLYTENQKNYILNGLGAKFIYSPKANRIMGMSGEEFAAEILKKKMNAAIVVCGENFRFGKGASCGVLELENFGNKYGFKVKICKILEKDGEKISSERIKEYLKNGGIENANKLLGRNFFIMGKVVCGNRLGRTISFPTINQLFERGQVIPKNGVYAASCEIDGKAYGAVTNIGVKPTLEENIKPLAETHILDFCGDLYGKCVKTDIIGFLREEKKFSSLNMLKKQIEKDIIKSKEILGQ